MDKKMVIIGAGGFALEVLDLIEDINHIEYTWDVLGFIDEDTSKKGTLACDLPILGNFDWFRENEYSGSVCIAVGSPALRKRFSEECEKIPGITFPNLIHPSVKINRYVHMGKGNILCPSTILTTHICMGDFNVINLHCTIGHEVVIGSFCTLSPAVNISGKVKLGDGCFLGTNCSVIEGRSIGEGSVIGAGAVVIRDIEAGCTAVGVPAKVIKTHKNTD